MKKKKWRGHAFYYAAKTSPPSHHPLHCAPQAIPCAAFPRYCRATLPGGVQIALPGAEDEGGGSEGDVSWQIIEGEGSVDGGSLGGGSVRQASA